MTKDYEPTAEQRKAIQSAVDAAIMPLIRQVLVKKIGQAAVFLKDEIDARYQPLSDDEIHDIAHRKATRYTHTAKAGAVMYGFSDSHIVDMCRAVERHVRGV